MRTAAFLIRIIWLRLRFRGRVDVDLGSRIGPGCRFHCPPGSGIRLRSAGLSRNVTLDVSDGGLIEIGKSFIGPGSILAAKERITVGDGCQIADMVTIRDHNHRHGPETPLAALQFTTGPVDIGDDVWLGSKVVVVAGVAVADHAVAAAGAVVTRDVPTWGRVGGVPARPLRG